MAKRKVKKVSEDALSEEISSVELNEKDARTAGAIHNLSQSVVKAVSRLRDPQIEIPSRALSNILYNERKRILEMGKKSTSRSLFNLSQAKSFMQTLLLSSAVNQLLRQGKTTSIRGLYYTTKHKIPGSNEQTFNDQSESDPILEDLEVVLQSLREELHLFAEKRGEMAGELVLVDRGDEIDCSRMGSGGYGIPSIVEPDVIQFKKCKAKFVLHVEKGTVWQRFNEDRFWEKHHCILTHGGGQPPRGVRRLLYRLHNELKLPIFCLLDNDPWGYYIYSVIKQGSINLAFESKRMAIPNAKFLGLRSYDFQRCGLSSSVQIELNDKDRKRAKQIAEYPWFAHKKAWQKEIDLMLKNGFKLEVEALVSKDISYVTDVYTPQRIAARDWLD
ncbi:MAG: DNA topoisomerase IV subunit A [Planctomycetia bacterium]|nr:DNA topoisomerase IV subunit A [Planctomycetia bacterium]